MGCFNAELALYDIDKIEAVFKAQELGLNLYRWVEDPENKVRFKVYSRETPLTLSDCLPMLEHMGLKVFSENPYLVTSDELPEKMWIHDFELIEPGGHALDLHDLKAKFEETFRRVWTGNMENDGFNRLVLRAGLEWSNIVVLRAYAKYLRQAGITFSQTYMMNTLSSNPVIAGCLIELFHARFDPSYEGDRVAKVAGILDGIWDQLTIPSSWTVRSWMSFPCRNRSWKFLFIVRGLKVCICGVVKLHVAVCAGRIAVKISGRKCSA